MKLLWPAQTDALTRGAIDVSFIIRTLNEAALLGRCLESLAAQQTDLVGEVVIVDSGSTDRTLDIARQHPVRIVEIPPGEFTYSSALNRGIEASAGGLVVLLSAHVIPLDGSWLARLADCMADVVVAGAHGRELPWPDADLYERLRLGPIFRPWRVERSLDSLAAGDCADDERLYFFSNAAACIRRELWERHPFQELPYAEDMEWARWALREGLRIVYEPRARVHHSHDESLRARAGREHSYFVAKCRIFGTDPGPVRACLGHLVQSVIFALRAAPHVSPWRLTYWSFWALWKWIVFCSLVIGRRGDVSGRSPPDGGHVKVVSRTEQRCVPS